MQTHDDRAVKVLNSLIETTMDSAHGYRSAAEGADNPEFKTLFAERANRREELCRRLQQEVRTFGGEPEDDQSLMGRVHNKFAEMRGNLGGRDDKGVIDEVERGEDVIKARFEEASRDADLPEPARQLVTTAYTEVKADHDTISQLKHRMH
ncbi:PA2169 family four-helix-bundle protein [uncultured Brevundimonas sp.]|mgnify:FL=1|uniref:PA2169 family four-helix-bundle protein n=1 Tax=uncultured Brevundimonas sp. TaxID=213418 RepID=UPI002633DDB3|nr:PA2169 family four-helix-bundle protein [uncultured Brevundimonas sp.]